MTGRRWPNPAEPGVPALALEDGFHWLALAETGEPTIGQWSPDLWCWVMTFWGKMVSPKNIAHLDYIGIAYPPYIWETLTNKTPYQPSPDDLSAESYAYMTTKKPVFLTASPDAVFNMLDHTESFESLSHRIEQFCQLISDPETAAVWRRDLLILLQQRHGKQPRAHA